MNKLGNGRKKFKVQRALLTELPGLGKPGALERRAYPPGQHGQSRRKFSEYGLRLREKQKLLMNYGLREEQLRRFVQKAKASPGHDWMSTLISLLERRLDNVVFRLGFAPSIAAARQMVSHGHVRVNGRKATIGSMLLSQGDQISLSGKAAKNANYAQAPLAPRLLLAEYLRMEGAPGAYVGTLRSLPDGDQVPFAFDKGLVTEFYSKI